MSQLVATARASVRPQPTRSGGSPLRVVSGRGEHLGGGGFVAVCLVLLLTGFLSVLVVNTSLAKGAFELRDLQARSGELTDRQENLEHAINAQSAPAVLAEKALALGMVPSESAAFLRLSDGKVLGVARPATRDEAFSVITSPHASPAADVRAAARQKQTQDRPRTTVVRKGTVTTTTVVTPRSDGSVVTVVTSVDSRTRTTTTTTRVTRVAHATTPAAAHDGPTQPARTRP